MNWIKAGDLRVKVKLADEKAELPPLALISFLVETVLDDLKERELVEVTSEGVWWNKQTSEMIGSRFDAVKFWIDNVLEI